MYIYTKQKQPFTMNYDEYKLGNPYRDSEQEPDHDAIFEQRREDAFLESIEKQNYQFDEWSPEERLSIALTCMEHFLNPQFAEASWDNPYSKKEATEILSGLYRWIGYNKETIIKLFTNKNQL